MYLNIILTIFVIIQIISIILIYKWWKKYGRKIFETVLNLNQKFQLPKNGFESNNPFGQIPDMNEVMKQFNQLTKNMGKIK